MTPKGVVAAALAVFAFAGGSTGGTSAQEPQPPEPHQSFTVRAKVWIPTDVPSMDLRRGPIGPGAFEPGATVTCDYLDKELSGASPKFACRLPDGDQLKVKYGAANGEVYGEVVASRLLWALGFGADHMYSVRVICRGCPEKVGGLRRDNGDRIVDPAAVERKFPGRELADEWGWDELELVSEEAGGATIAERDAFKLLAVLLQHSDSKAKNQRVVCAGGASPGKKADCRIPLLMIQDLGVTFGRANATNYQPRASVNLAEWKQVPIWKRPTGCVGNLSGSWTGTLKEPVIGEEGRRLLADLLLQLTDQQIRDMFEAARVHLRPRDPEMPRSGLPSVDEWVTAFKQKRTEIVERRCVDEGS